MSAKEDHGILTFQSTDEGKIAGMEALELLQSVGIKPRITRVESEIGEATVEFWGCGVNADGSVMIAEFVEKVRENGLASYLE